jgi:hypothetical protein
MSISMHSMSVPVFVRMLENLLRWLEKAEAHATAKKFDIDVLMTARLAPDMLPFSAQVGIATDSAKLCVARLTGADAPKFADDETRVEQLKERVRRTLEFLRSVPAARFEGSETRDVTIPLRTGSIVLKGEIFLKHFSLPNFFFHVTTTYDLLRHNGVELGKMDFLGALQ